MGNQTLAIPNIIPGDWKRTDLVIRRIKQKLGASGNPEFTSLTVSGLTANSLIYPDSNGLLTSLGAATNGQLPIGSTDATPVLATLTGTANQVTVTNGAGSITLATPQDIATDSSPTFNGLTSTGTVDASSGKVLVEDNDVTEPTSESDGYMGVAKIDGNARIYFQVDGQLYYVSGTFDVAVATGNPIGLLLTLTYA